VAGFDKHGNQFSGFTCPEDFTTGNLMFRETGRLDSSLTNFISNAALTGGKGKEEKESVPAERVNINAGTSRLVCFFCCRMLLL
jgi:hypothetical protein